MLRRTLEIRRRVFGEQNRETLVTMYWLAGQLARCGKLEAAEELATRCVELSRQLDNDLIVRALCEEHAGRRVHRPGKPGAGGAAGRSSA